MRPIDREAPIRELDAELARRASARGPSGGYLALGGLNLCVGLVSAFRLEVPLFALLGVVLFVMSLVAGIRNGARDLDRRRIEYARAFLAGLELGPDAVVQLRVALDPTDGRRHEIRPALHRHDWLTLRATFDSGVELTLTRTDELRIVTAEIVRRGIPAAEERIDLRLPEPGERQAYRAQRELAFPPSFSLAAPTSTEWIIEKVEPRELVLAFRDERPWAVGAVPEGGVDAPAATLRLLRRITKAADLPSLVRCAR